MPTAIHKVLQTPIVLSYIIYVKRPYGFLRNIPTARRNFELNQFIDLNFGTKANQLNHRDIHRYHLFGGQDVMNGCMNLLVRAL